MNVICIRESEAAQMVALSGSMYDWEIELGATIGTNKIHGYKLKIVPSIMGYNGIVVAVNPSRAVYEIHKPTMMIGGWANAAAKKLANNYDAETLDYPMGWHDRNTCDRKELKVLTKRNFYGSLPPWQDLLLNENLFFVGAKDLANETAVINRYVLGHKQVSTESGVHIDIDEKQKPAKGTRMFACYLLKCFRVGMNDGWTSDDTVLNPRTSSCPRCGKIAEEGSNIAPKLPAYADRELKNAPIGKQAYQTSSGCPQIGDYQRHDRKPLQTGANDEVTYIHHVPAELMNSNVPPPTLSSAGGP